MDGVRPTTLGEALYLRALHPDALLLCGATYWMGQQKAATSKFQTFIDISKVKELRNCQREGSFFEVGAALSYTEVASFLAPNVIAVAQACQAVGTPQVRNQGTLGGAVALALPNADLLPALLAVDAEVVLASTRGERVLAMNAFVEGPLQTSLQPDEIITALRFPLVQGPQAYRRMGRRAAFCFPEVAAAVALFVREHDRIEVHVAVTAGEGAIRALQAERLATEALVSALSAPSEDFLLDFSTAVEEALGVQTKECPQIRRMAAAAVAVQALQDVWGDPREEGAAAWR